MRSPGIIDQASDPLCLISGEPAVERAVPDIELTARSFDANFKSQADSSHPKADLVKAWLSRLTGGPTVLSGQEQEPRSFLVPVPTNATMRIGGVELSRVRHAGTVGPAVPYLSRKFN